jgi:hypothetical protein
MTADYTELRKQLETEKKRLTEEVPSVSARKRPRRRLNLKNVWHWKTVPGRSWQESNMPLRSLKKAPTGYAITVVSL